MRFASLCLVTADLPALAAFYRTVLGQEPEGDETFCSLVLAGADLSIYTVEGTEAMAPGSMAGAGYGGCVLEFEVEDVDAEFERLAGAGLPIVKPPTTQPWGRRSVWFRDPDGNIVNLNASVPPA